ncbi:MAG: methionyl-tRNA formyltransferase [Deltaproteobacteria bacterium]|jgi:methionyl-tRNA formyltransferase|nr:methionyl-tRNA formyltransferase [Deltaproteobacteria bacterium]
MSAPNKSASSLNITFFGSDLFAMPALSNILKGPDKVNLAISSPPARSGRGQTLTPTPIAIAARQADVKVYETDDVNSQESLNIIEQSKPDLLVVAAYGHILGKKLINLCSVPPINIHPSLLPRHRGPAPVNWTLISGDAVCGVSICYIEPKIDSGPVLLKKSLPVPEGLGAAAIQERLSHIGAELLMEAIEKIKDDSIAPVVQDENLATTNRLLTKNDGLINFNNSANTLMHLINGVDPWPGAQAVFNGKKIKLFGAFSAQGQGYPGEILGLDEERRLIVGAGSGALALSALQPESRKILSAAEFYRGYRPTKLENAANS